MCDIITNQEVMRKCLLHGKNLLTIDGGFGFGLVVGGGEQAIAWEWEFILEPPHVETLQVDPIQTHRCTTTSHASRTQCYNTVNMNSSGATQLSISSFHCFYFYSTGCPLAPPTPP